jgi:hypothetical protein
MTVTSLDHVYRRLREAWGEETPQLFRDVIVLDEEARTVYSSPLVLDRLVAARITFGSAVPAWSSLYTWASEAVREGESDAELIAVSERVSAAQRCVERSDGVETLLREHERAVEQGDPTQAQQLSEPLPVMVVLLNGAGRGDETARVLEHLERLGDLPTLGRCLLRAGVQAPETVARYVDSMAANLRSALGMIHRDQSLRSQLLTLALVCQVYSRTADDSEGLSALGEAYRLEPRRFTALFWGEEATGFLVESVLGAPLEGIRLWQEACRERWFFDWFVQLAEQPEAEAFCELLATAAQRSGRVAAWLAEEPATAPVKAAGLGWRFRFFLRRAGIPRGSLYAQFLASTLREGPMLDDEQVTKLRRLVDSTVPVEPRRWLLVGVLFGLSLLSGLLLDQGLWLWYSLCLLLTAIPAGLLTGHLLLMEFFMFLWSRPVFLPLRETKRGVEGLQGTIRGWGYLSDLRVHRWLFRKSAFRERRLVPLWELAAYREEVQENHRFSIWLSEVLGGRPIHTADDVCVLLSRKLPRETV